MGSSIGTFSDPSNIEEIKILSKNDKKILVISPEYYSWQPYDKGLDKYKKYYTCNNTRVYPGVAIGSKNKNTNYFTLLGDTPNITSNYLSFPLNPLSYKFVLDNIAIYSNDQLHRISLSLIAISNEIHRIYNSDGVEYDLSNIRQECEILWDIILSGYDVANKSQIKKNNSDVYVKSLEQVMKLKNNFIDKIQIKNQYHQKPIPEGGEGTYINGSSWKNYIKKIIIEIAGEISNLNKLFDSKLINYYFSNPDKVTILYNPRNLQFIIDELIKNGWIIEYQSNSLNIDEINKLLKLNETVGGYVLGGENMQFSIIMLYVVLLLCVIYLIWQLYTHKRYEKNQYRNLL